VVLCHQPPQVGWLAVFVLLLCSCSGQGSRCWQVLAIRRHHFAAGELDDGGGAVPPTAAGELPGCMCAAAVQLQWTGK
jgi:hypothetical protein